MAATRRWYDQPEWIYVLNDLAPRGVKTIVRDSATQFTVQNVDALAYFTPGRRIQIAGSSTEQAHVVSASKPGSDTIVIVENGVVPTTPTAVGLFLSAELKQWAFGLGGAMTGSLNLENDEGVTAKDTPGGTDLNLVRRPPTNETVVGDAAQPTEIVGSGELTHNGSIVLTQANSSTELTSEEVEFSPLPDLDTSGRLDVSHSLGVMPTRLNAFIECLTADEGYVAGDRLTFPIYQTASTTAQLGIDADASDVFFWRDGMETDIQFWSITEGEPKAFGGSFFTYSSWKLVVRVSA